MQTRRFIVNPIEESDVINTAASSDYLLLIEFEIARKLLRPFDLTLLKFSLGQEAELTRL